MMPSGQKQTITTQTTPTGTTTTTTVVTTTPTVPVINQTTLGSIGIAKTVEKKIEEQKMSQAANTKQPLNALLEKTLAVTFGKDKPVSHDDLSFHSTENIAELPQRVLDILMFHGITFSVGDRIVHTPGALFFSLVQQTPEGKKYTSFSFNEQIPETTVSDHSFDELSSEEPDDYVDDSDTVVSESMIESLPVQASLLSDQTTSLATPVAGTLGTIGLRSTDTSKVVAESRNNFSSASSYLNTPSTIAVTSDLVSEATTPPMSEVSPESWSFEKEIIKGPKPAITIEEKIKEATTFADVHRLITSEPLFADQPSEDVWMLIRNYTHGLISIERIPRDFGLQKKVDELKQKLDTEQTLLELPSLEKTQSVTQLPVAATSSLATLLQATAPAVDTNHAAVLESLGLVSAVSTTPTEVISMNDLITVSPETKSTYSRTMLYQTLLQHLSRAFEIPVDTL